MTALAGSYIVSHIFGNFFEPNFPFYIFMKKASKSCALTSRSIIEAAVWNASSESRLFDANGTQFEWPENKISVFMTGPRRQNSHELAIPNSWHLIAPQIGTQTLFRK